MTKYADLGDFDEDERIEVIGKTVTCGKTVVFITDSDPGKADRYIAKLQKKFPAVVVIARGKGPVKGTVTIKVGPQTKNN